MLGKSSNQSKLIRTTFGRAVLEALQFRLSKKRTHLRISYYDFVQYVNVDSYRRSPTPLLHPIVIQILLSSMHLAYYGI